MKYKCGKCGALNEVLSAKIIGTDDTSITIACEACGTSNKLPKSPPVAKKQVEKTAQNLNNTNREETFSSQEQVPGWLFVHDENTTRQSFDLKPGKNIIGRKSSFPANIAIETRDEYMSRRHCIIEVIRNAGTGFSFRLSDYNAVNGTFINGHLQKKLDPSDILLLGDGDVLQLGLTKIAFRVNTNMLSKEKILVQLNEVAYAPTVYIKRK